MYRVHPTENKYHHREPIATVCPSVLTVWKKSSMSFQGTDGFSVFNCEGKLVFRVDNYARSTGGVVLMDGIGRALLTLRPQILSMHYQWNGFKETEGSKTRLRTPFFSMRRHSIFQSGQGDQAEVFMVDPTNQAAKPDFRIDGSFRRRHCKIQRGTGEVVAEISRKKVNPGLMLSDDVFSLVVQPGFDSELIMAFIVIMDRICRKPYTPALCS